MTHVGGDTSLRPETDARRRCPRANPGALNLNPRPKTLDREILARILLVAPVLLFSLVAHEWAHAYAALKQGDPTAYQLGRLTFNPIKHIDPFMTIILPTLMLVQSGGTTALGGAKPCPVNPRNYKNYKRGDIIVSLAGVTMNALLGVACAMLIGLFGLLGQAVPGAASVLKVGQEMMYWGVQTNMLLVFFNLLPIPPLDGSHVVKHFLPPSLSIAYQRVGRYGFLILIALLYFGGPVLRFWLAPGSAIGNWLVRGVAPLILAMR